MVRFLAKLFLSVLIGNWIYSEIIYFVPSVDQFSRRLIQTCSIPTHPEWPEIAQSSDAKRLALELGSIRFMDGQNLSYKVFGHKVLVLWDWTFRGQAPKADRRPYLTGDAIFINASESNRNFRIISRLSS